MAPQLFGIEHILYIVITAIAGGAGLLFAKKFAKTEKAQSNVLKLLGLLLFVSIVTNRLSQVFRYGDARWYCIIPDSICGMTSLMLSLGVLVGKKDNGILHFTWLLGLFGGISTVIYATFLDQDVSFFYLPTISGLLHHSLAAMVAVAVLMFRYIEISYKKWHYTLFGFMGYVTVGAFLMNIFDLSDAMHLAEPLLDDTPLTIWVMAPMYAVGYAMILFVAELIKKHKKENKA
jgi:hypothetical protein